LLYACRESSLLKNPIPPKEAPKLLIRRYTSYTRGVKAPQNHTAKQRSTALIQRSTVYSYTSYIAIHYTPSTTPLWTKPVVLYHTFSFSCYLQGTPSASPVRLYFDLSGKEGSILCTSFETLHDSDRKPSPRRDTRELDGRLDLFGDGG
jgi:hypothetical protein